MTETLSGPDLGGADHQLDLATLSIRAIGTTASVTVTDPHGIDDALALVADDLCDLDRACSRFRPESELRRLERSGGGRPVPVSPLLFELLEVACAVAVKTAGTVDPTIGSAVIELGYDRDLEELAGGVAVPERKPRPAPGWWQIALDPDAGTVAIPSGVQVDLGATAKAYAADRCAQHVADVLGCGALVNLGGDVAVAGTAPPGGWAIGIAAECTTPVTDVDEVVALFGGGLATSGTTARVWVRNGRLVHHIVDPRTGTPAAPVWSLVSTAAPSCVEANAWSTAAVVWGEDAVGNLDIFGVSARLVDSEGVVVRVGDWPEVARGQCRPGRRTAQ